MFNCEKVHESPLVTIKLSVKDFISKPQRYHVRTKRKEDLKSGTQALRNPTRKLPYVLPINNGFFFSRYDV